MLAQMLIYMQALCGFFADQSFPAQLDYLFIDEASQVALANVLAMAACTHNIVLIGDQMQLGQPMQGVHPGRLACRCWNFYKA